MLKGVMKRTLYTGLTLGLTLLGGCSLFTPSTEKAPVKATPPPVFKPVKFAQLKGWNQQQAEGLRTALLESCKVYTRRSGPVSGNPRFGTYEQWKPLCQVLPSLESEALTAFFKQEFRAYQVSPKQKGLITGYFTPLLYGSRTRTERFPVPLLTVPDDLIRFNPKDFGLQKIDEDRPNRMLAAKVRNGWMVPYDDRESINKRTAKGDYDNNVLFWVENKVDRLFLQIQGSGTVRLQDGEDVQVRFSGRNGHAYFAIGRYMKRQGMLDKVSMQSIRQWLAENPERVDEVLYTNPDFIFFSELGKPGPIGAQGTRLVPEHSAAVDDSVIPLGTPILLNTTLSADGKPFRRAMVAQDVGSAIRGHVRADIFFGAGEDAAHKAGLQNAGGKLFVLVPRKKL